MKQKVIAVILSLTMTAGLLAGCGSAAGGGEETVQQETVPESDEAQEADKPADTAGGENVVIEVLSLKTEAGPQAAFQEMFDHYTAQHPNVTFEMQSMSSDDFKTTIRARAAANDMPDLVTWMKEIEPEFLSDINGEAFLDNLNADTVAGANAIYDNAVYAMPIDNGYIGLYYNKDVLAANHIEIPSTYSELVAACETLQANGVTPFASSLSDLSVPYMSLIALFAETVYAPDSDWSTKRDAGEVTIKEDAGWKQAFDILTDVVYQYSNPDMAYNQSYDDCAALIANGETAFYGNGS